MKTTGITLKVKPAYVAGNRTVKIPFANENAYLNPIRVDWGDGVVESYSSGSLLQHTYLTDDDNAEYLVRISSVNGRLPAIDYYYSFESEVDDQAHLTIIAIKYANVNWYDDDEETTGNDVVCFMGCHYLVKNVASLLKNNPNITTIKSLLYHTNVTSISGLLFKHNSDVTRFIACFCFCYYLTSIPSNIFKNNKNVTNIEGCFVGCTGITSIPQNLFIYNSNATNFNSCFGGCDSLTSIPQNLFIYNSSATNFNSCFLNCPNLTGNAPELWTTHASATGTQCFRGCTGLSNYSDIPNDWK